MARGFRCNTQSESFWGSIVKGQTSFVDRCKEAVASVWQDVIVGGPRLGTISDPIHDLTLPARPDLGMLFTRSYCHLAPTAEPMLSLPVLPDIPTEVRVRDPKRHAVIYLTEEQAEAVKNALLEQYASHGEVREVPPLLKALM
jgi:hypothetical protein